MGKLHSDDQNTQQTAENSGSVELSRHSKNSASANWQIPIGVSKGTWDYICGNQIAQNYDDFLRDDPLTRIDREIVNRYLPPFSPNHQKRITVADFGCGAGRAAIKIATSGYHVLAIDLSLPMLCELNRKKSEIEPEIAERVISAQANLVELNHFSNESIDHAVCLFSTLGMIQGAENRAQFLRHVRRMMKPQGQFILHAHNIWFQSRHPGGKRWLVSNWMESLRGRCEFGDRTATYRNVRNMFIHSFRRSELTAAFHQAGFTNLNWFGIAPDNDSAIENPSRFKSLKQIGWIVVAQ